MNFFSLPWRCSLSCLWGLTHECPQFIVVDMSKLPVVNRCRLHGVYRAGSSLVPCPQCLSTKVVVSAAVEAIVYKKPNVRSEKEVLSAVIEAIEPRHCVDCGQQVQARNRCARCQKRRQREGESEATT